MAIIALLVLLVLASSGAGDDSAPPSSAVPTMQPTTNSVPPTAGPTVGPIPQPPTGGTSRAPTTAPTITAGPTAAPTVGPTAPTLAPAPTTGTPSSVPSSIGPTSLTSGPADAPSAVPTNANATAGTEPAASMDGVDGVDGEIFEPNGPCVACEALPAAFVECAAPSEDQCDFTANRLRHDEVARVGVSCTVIAGIECFGPSPYGCSDGTDLANGTRSFVRPGVPCIRYSGHYYLTTLLVSIFFGFLGADQFMLGNVGVGLGKLFTLGGVGIWWVIDIALLAAGETGPADGSAWEPYY